MQGGVLRCTNLDVLVEVKALALGRVLCDDRLEDQTHGRWEFKTVDDLHGFFVQAIGEQRDVAIGTSSVHLTRDDIPCKENLHWYFALPAMN